MILPPASNNPPNRIRYVSLIGNQIQSQSDARVPVGSTPYSNLLLQFFGGVSRGVTIANNVSQCNSTVHGNMTFVQWGSEFDESKYWFVHDNLAEDSGGANVAGVMASDSMTVTGGVLGSWNTTSSEPEYKMVHDNISGSTAQDKFSGSAWAGETGDNNHDNQEY
jgi:hypothetical protein